MSWGQKIFIDSSWNVMAHGDAWEGKWRGNWRMEWVASTLHTTSEYGVSSITTADAHTSAASSRLNWRPRRFKWTRPFHRKKKSGFCACAITFQLASNNVVGFKCLIVKRGYMKRLLKHRNALELQLVCELIYRVIQKDGLNWRANGTWTHVGQLIAVFQVLCSLYGLTKMKCTLHSSRRISFNELTDAKSCAA